MGIARLTSVDQAAARGVEFIDENGGGPGGTTEKETSEEIKRQQK
jgi:hypothetical protein